MLKPIRDTFCQLLSRYFHLIPLPASFATLRKDPCKYIVVYRYQSVYFEALLRSFAERANIELVKSTCVTKADQSDALLFCALEDIPLLQPNVFQDRTFITMNVIRGRGPVRTTPKYALNSIDIISLLLGPALGRLLLVTSFGDAIEHRKERSALSAKQLQRQLKLDFYRNIRVVRGTPFQAFDIQSQVVLSGEDFQKELKNLQARNAISEGHALKLVRREFSRIAASPRSWAYLPASLIAHFLIKRLFSDVIVKGLEEFAQATKSNPVILVPLHRSHLDYVLMGYILYRSRLNPPLVAAGVNLSFWPAGQVIRSLGGYFVKRDSRNDRVHALVLRRYVTYLLKRGHLQEFFIEGGRSRSGAMRLPKLGLLNIFVSAIKSGARKDLLFVPVSITYENVIEDRIYGDENTGKAKVKENLFALVKARKFLSRKYGEVTIRFDKPVSLKEYLQKSEISGSSRKVVHGLGMHLTHRIQDSTSVSLTSLLYTVLMSTPHYGLVESKYRMLVGNFVRNALMSPQLATGSSELTPALRQFLDYPDQPLSFYTDRLLISRKEYINEDFFFIPGKARFTADFYRNSVIHLFLPTAFISASELLYGSITEKTVQEVYELFKYSFVVPEWCDYWTTLQVTLKELDSLNILGDGIFKKRVPGFFTPELLLPTVQAMLWVLHHLERLREKDPEVPESELLELLIHNADTGKYSGLLTATESASKPQLNTAVLALKKLGVLRAKEREGKAIVFLREQPHELRERLVSLNKHIIDWQFANLQQHEIDAQDGSTFDSFQFH